ncbi:MAG: hypothetical protein IPJ00_15735 [Saprospirales bacterium]|nr:hypothetical protein [Saprospirales bacterium]
MKTTYFFLFLAALTLSSCSPRLSYFTQDLVKENNWSEEELKQIQFYLSNSIVLRREANSGDSQIREGGIRIRNGRKVEEIVIPAGTPGVFLFRPKENRLAVSFEKSGDKRFLMFGPNPKISGRYVLLAAEWKKRQGQVTYDGSTWWVDDESAIAALMVDLKRSRQVSVKSRVAPGRTVN